MLKWLYVYFQLHRANSEQPPEPLKEKFDLNSSKIWCPECEEEIMTSFCLFWEPWIFAHVHHLNHCELGDNFHWKLILMMQNNVILLILTNVPYDPNFRSWSKGKLFSHGSTDCWGLEYTGLLSNLLWKLGFLWGKFKKIKLNIILLNFNV